MTRLAVALLAWLWLCPNGHPYALREGLIHEGDHLIAEEWVAFNPHQRLGGNEPVVCWICGAMPLPSTEYLVPWDGTRDTRL